jgi:hypothetical protein
MNHKNLIKSSLISVVTLMLAFSTSYATTTTVDSGKYFLMKDGAKQVYNNTETVHKDGSKDITLSYDSTTYIRHCTGHDSSCEYTNDNGKQSATELYKVENKGVYSYLTKVNDNVVTSPTQEQTRAVLLLNVTDNTKDESVDKVSSITVNGNEYENCVKLSKNEFLSGKDMYNYNSDKKERSITRYFCEDVGMVKQNIDTKYYLKDKLVSEHKYKTSLKSEPK